MQAKPPVTAGWPPYGLPPSYTPLISDYIPPIRFGNTSSFVNNPIPPLHPEFSQDYQMGSTSSGSSSMAAFRQYVDESYHGLVNLLTQQMTTILNPMMTDHESKFEHLARQVERIARIVDYDEGDQNLQINQKNGMNIPENMGGDMHFERDTPQVVRRDQNVDKVLARMRANQHGERY
ncbi:hypothetical protein Ahy_A07g033572 [Arachis hypogaea]|uniref:Uncharacterized protein n=1 Tax=Arachis hypogaea TaxID=3818 RepID=A0A445C9M6_ARAHY|nr:hypothetical protein Ahy_A07g033572 [Arachis hypogaea]